jgi:acetyl-CoA carboxylase biotin carboxyl carrier protein
VADEPSSVPNPFDVQTVRVLAGLMSRHDLSEIDLSDGGRRLRLRRGPRGRVAVLPPHPAPATVAPPAAVSAPAPTTNTAPARRLIDIKSPGPGIFYASLKPDTPPYVTQGARVTPETVVGQIGAMKVFNEITAGCSGVIAEILVENEQHLEYGQVLFRVDPAG